ncbi:MAG TPA: glycerophosphodiester phosphodiesterase, partial [Burkholderiales bacterium]|nr:glycerophosphodiester phosphodiesterase [Burkholderiales bacterium]
ENTLPGFAKAIEMGVTTLELDTGVTLDGVVVVHHDRRLNPDVARSPGGEWVSPPGPTIYSLTYDELRRYDVGRLKPGSAYAKRFPTQKALDGARVPRLADLFGMAGRSNVRFNIETKLLASHPDETLPPEAFARALIKEIRKAGLERRTTIQSFDFRTLKVVEREAAEIETVYLTEGEHSDPARVREAGARVWSPDFKALSRQVVDEAHRLGLRIVAWTVNEPADIQRMIDWRIDGIISDYPERVIAALKQSRER